MTGPGPGGAAGSVRKLQRSLDRLEARLVAQRIEERVNFRVREIRVPVPHRRLEPIERAGSIAPLRVDVGVSLGQPISRNGTNLGKHRFGLGVSPELVVDHCQAPGSVDFARSYARGTGALEVTAQLVSDSKPHVDGHVFLTHRLTIPRDSYS